MLSSVLPETPNSPDPNEDPTKPPTEEPEDRAFLSKNRRHLRGGRSPNLRSVQTQDGGIRTKP